MHLLPKLRHRDAPQMPELRRRVGRPAAPRRAAERGLSEKQSFTTETRRHREKREISPQRHEGHEGTFVARFAREFSFCVLCVFVSSW
jgi:hypothetical protein